MSAVLDDRTLKITRLFAASPERVFDAWAKQELFVQWMCPPGVMIDECTIDVRPGGAWRIRGHHSGDRVFASSGKYVEVKRPQRLVFTWAHHANGDFTQPRGHETTVRIELRAVGSKTELILIHGPFQDTPALENHREGWMGSFDKLVSFLGRIV